MGAFNRWLLLLMSIATMSCVAVGSVPGDGAASLDALLPEDVAGLTADTRSVLVAQEGQACSTSPSDDPELVCTTAMRLVCITTFGRQVTNPDEAAKYDGGVRPVFVCRTPCATTLDCPLQSDVCCPGPIYGPAGGAMRACVPPSSCETSPSRTDGGI